ncbi:hypothetical protein [Curtobacterium aurantiacum]|uniref:Integral membrane protein n=1 Tax=Curtobacterium aurantiacum TaxID=3236919 RepID=A0ABS5VA66_9MICO|nr:hypothetical protein [Curtobacterium flaccumfaciens]MBT1544002.1 hypothetical protein [Curtobacterium flaccumfaciens pv. flaccumfaciens]MBT1586369.1 hypothetical protein [Curtobacterium flaccumfaciens pv. flaccumfaciens]
MTLIAIIVCEIAFWVAILGGLTTRYLLRRPRLGAALLVAAPVIDLALLAVVTVDLLGGGTASWHHGLAAIYIGFSVAYGHRMIAWADVRFTHRFAGGPAPERLSGRRHTARCWGDVLRTGLAVLIAGGVIGALVLVVGDPERTSELQGTVALLGVILGIELLWAISYTIWPRRTATAAASPAGPSSRP